MEYLNYPDFVHSIFDSFYFTNDTIKMIKYLLAISVFITACTKTNSKQDFNNSSETPSTSLVILGNVQDAGSPQIGCKKSAAKNFLKPLIKIEK